MRQTDRQTDSAPTYERRKLVKSYKNMLPQKRTVVAEVCKKTYFKNDKKRWRRKTATDLK